MVSTLLQNIVTQIGSLAMCKVLDKIDLKKSWPPELAYVHLYMLSSIHVITVGSRVCQECMSTLCFSFFSLQK